MNGPREQAYRPTVLEAIGFAFACAVLVYLIVGMP